MKSFFDDELVSSEVHMLCISQRINLSTDVDITILSK